MKTTFAGELCFSKACFRTQQTSFQQGKLSRCSSVQNRVTVQRMWPGNVWKQTLS